jgi:hypothetical protein
MQCVVYMRRKKPNSAKPIAPSYGQFPYYVYASPEGTPKGIRRALPTAPYPGAPVWQCSVYYFWWEYLRRNEGYIDCCKRRGKGRFSKLYQSFGDVRRGDFPSWWIRHARLFSETAISPPELIPSGLARRYEETHWLIAVPKDSPTTLSVRRVRRLLRQLGANQPRKKKPNYQKLVSTAEFPVATKPVIRSLYLHLKVWDARKAHPNATLAELADIAGLSVTSDKLNELRTLQKTDPDIYIGDGLRDWNRKKSILVSRHLRIARQYIENVGKGLFPVRDSR